MSDAIQQLLLDLRTAAGDLEGVVIGLDQCEIGGKSELVAVARIPPMVELLFLVHERYPSLPPILQASIAGERKELETVRWTSEKSAAENLRTKIQSIISGRSPFRVAWGLHPEKPVTEDPVLGRKWGLRPIVTGSPLVPLPTRASESRLGSEVAAAMQRSTAVLVGLGSVGSYLAEQLARTGIGGIIGIDNDLVEAHNLTRTIYELQDIGERKAVALRRRLTAINPEVDVEVWDSDFTQLPGQVLRGIFDKASIVVAATDEPVVQHHINACAFSAGKPAIFPSLYRGAQGGEVVLAIPGITPCYSCCTGTLRRLADAAGINPGRQVDNYGRLAGEVGLNADIQHVASAALKLVISLLTIGIGPFGQTANARLVLGMLERSLHLVTFGMVPDYWFFPEVFAPIRGGQHAFQSVWVRAESSPDCSVCGAQRESHDPFEFMELRVSKSVGERVLRKLHD